VATRSTSSPIPTHLDGHGSRKKAFRSIARSSGARWLDDWTALLDLPTDQIVTAMLGRTQQGIDLRQMTPFAGVLSDAERRKALRSVPSTDAA